MMKGHRNIRTPDPAATRALYARLQPPTEEVHAKMGERLAYVSKHAMDELRRQSVVPPEWMHPPGMLGGFNGMEVEVVPWLPYRVTMDRKARRKRRWTRVKRDREHARKMREFNESVELLKRLVEPRHEVSVRYSLPGICLSTPIYTTTMGV